MELCRYKDITETFVSSVEDDTHSVVLFFLLFSAESRQNSVAYVSEYLTDYIKTF
jgi:hypothetical protein